MRRFGLFQYACLLWFVNVVIVILSYFVSSVRYAALLLYPAVFIAFGSMIILGHKEGIGFEQVLKNSAAWSKAIAFTSVIYTFVNFFICMFLLREGGPHIDNGVYCLWNHSFIREITKDEYEALLLVEGRMSVGHLLAFSAIPVVFFSGRKSMKHLD